MVKTTMVVVRPKAPGQSVYVYATQITVVIWGYFRKPGIQLLK